jgi:hypothetical protein
MWDMFRGREKETAPGLAADDAVQFTEEAIRLLDEAEGTGWYELPGNQMDAAVVALCRLRRAGAGHRAGIEGGDEAVRDVLQQARPEAVIWLASRTISYMDENGFPELMEASLGRG